MIVCTDIDALEDALKELRADGQTIGFVPTMGALHEGHLSLVRLSDQHADKIITSIYVNPTQFAPHEDFDSYPRNIDGDLQLFADQGVDVVFLPQEADMYPNGPQVTIKAGAAAQGLETDFRPHFFDGVCSAVYRLLKLIRPDVAAFGEKDFQQLMVIREMVKTERLSVEILGGPIARDAHGLALSSRNAYLSEAELETARMLNQALFNAAQTPDEETLKETQEMLIKAGFDKVDYIAHKPEWDRLLVAAWIGKTRLIDNCEVSSIGRFTQPNKERR